MVWEMAKSWVWFVGKHLLNAQMPLFYLLTHCIWWRTALLQCPCCVRWIARHTTEQQWMRQPLNHCALRCPCKHEQCWVCMKFIDKHGNFWFYIFGLLPPNLRALPGICCHSCFRVKVVRGCSESLISNPQIHTQEKTQCSHEQDHQPSNKGLLDHFPETIQNMNIGWLRQKHLRA